MGRLLEALRAESEARPVATPATPATPRPESSRVAREAAPLSSQIDRLLAALRAEGLPDDWVGRDHGDAAALTLLGDEVLHAYLLAMADSDLRARGIRPDDETAPAVCRSCGPVWVAPEVARVAPEAHGWPLVLGCPWCHVRNRDAIPRPPVTCGTCSNFLRDTMNPTGGAGSCAAGCVPSLPFASRQCATWRMPHPCSHSNP